MNALWVQILLPTLCCTYDTSSWIIKHKNNNYELCVSRFLATFLIFFSNIINVAYVDNFNLIT